MTNEEAGIKKGSIVILKSGNGKTGKVFKAPAKCDFVCVLWEGKAECLQARTAQLTVVGFSES